MMGTKKVLGKGLGQQGQICGVTFLCAVKKVTGTDHHQSVQVSRDLMIQDESSNSGKISPESIWREWATKKKNWAAANLRRGLWEVTKRFAVLPETR